MAGLNLQPLVPLLPNSVRHVYGIVKPSAGFYTCIGVNSGLIRRNGRMAARQVIAACPAMPLSSRSRISLKACFRRLLLRGDENAIRTA